VCDVCWSILCEDEQHQHPQKEDKASFPWSGKRGRRVGRKEGSFYIVSE